MGNRGALQRQRGALAIAASNAVFGGNYPADPGDYAVLSPPEVFSGWQTSGVSYAAIAADAGKKVAVFFSGGFQEVGADGDTCFDNATFVTERPALTSCLRPYLRKHRCQYRIARLRMPRRTGPRERG